MTCKRQPLGLPFVFHRRRVQRRQNPQHYNSRSGQMSTSPRLPKQPPSVQVKLTDILVADRLRALQPETVAAIEESFQTVGQLQPIVVRAWKASQPHMVRHILVAGNHRLEAARRLKWKTIAAVVIECTGVDIELAEIDENLMRAELSPAERKLHIGRRKELYETRFPEAKTGKAPGAGKGKGKVRKNAKIASFVDDTAAKTGRSRSSVARDARHAKIVEVLGEIPGTSLDTDSEIEALSRLPAGQQRDLAEQAKAGQVTAKPSPVKASPPVSPLPDKADDGLATLLRRLHAVLRGPAAEAGIKLAIVEMGAVSINEIVTRLKAALNEHAAGNATRAIADRAEARSKAAASNDDLTVPTFLDRSKMN
jgi:hypothetical protein